MFWERRIIKWGMGVMGILMVWVSCPGGKTLNFVMVTLLIYTCKRRS